jgi:NADH:ubiquinone reductase (H+-translocating)
MNEIVIVGGGFAGVWAALGADSTRRQIGAEASSVGVTLVSRDPWLTIRPRLYESSLHDARVALDSILAPAGVGYLVGEVSGIDPSAQTVMVSVASEPREVPYDRLILASGSRVHRPAIPGIERARSVDTYAEAVALARHLAELPALPDREGRFTAVVVGAGFTGIEVATELASRLRNIAGGHRARVVLVDGGPAVARDLGSGARRHIEDALSALSIEWRAGVAVTAIGGDGVALQSGDFIPAATAVWTGGFRASPLSDLLPVERDPLGRLPVDSMLRVIGVEAVYAAGDIARAMAAPGRVAPMSCQHAIPMGTLAGSNAVSDLLGARGTAYEQPDHVVCLDLGAAGALFMEGWEPEVRLSGFWAKLMKQMINTQLIYPPREVERPAAPVLGSRSAA